ncbi:MAG: hypothetical protein FJX80_06890, partial [Bacteroidetes bacterium]|nr:hypothetical protein [Bacteroidota bacterium]
MLFIYIIYIYYIDNSFFILRMTDNRRTETDYFRTQILLKTYDEHELSKLEMPQLIREYAQRLLEILTFKSLVTENAEPLRKNLIEKLKSKDVTQIFNIDMNDVTKALSTESAERQPADGEQQSAAPAEGGEEGGEEGEEEGVKESAAVAANAATNQGGEESAAPAVRDGGEESAPKQQTVVAEQPPTAPT